ncbi:MAG: ComEC/Rec2 family competence protein [Lawsonella sp.]
MENSPKYGTTPPSKTTGYSVTRPHNPIHDIRLIIPALYLWGMTITVLHTGATGLIAYNAVLIGLSILGAGITLWKTRSAQPHKLALILLPLLITSLAGSLNLGLRLPLATQVTAGDVAEVKGRIITRPTTYPTTYPNARGERTRYLLSSPQGEITLIKRGEQPLGFVPGATVTVLAKNIEPPTHQLSQGEWNLITVRSVGKTRGVWRLSNAIYRRWDNALNIAEQGKLYTPDTHALARGLTIGDTSGLSFPKRDAYRAAGLSHLTAVSGANVAFLLIFVGTLLRHQTPRRKAAASISLLLVFVAVVGPEPSILRAAVSGSVGVLALYLGHRKQALPALGAGIILLLFLRPSFAVSPGFVLSVVATTGLILGARPLNTLLQAQHVPTYLADILAVSITAHLVTTPLTAYFFGTISTLGIIANILVAPLMPIVTAAGLIGIIISCINPLVGAVAAAAAWPAVRWVDLVGTIFGSGTWSQIILPPGAVSALLVTAAVATVVLCVTAPKTLTMLAILLVVGSGVTTWHALTQAPATHCLTADPTTTVEIPHPLPASQLAELPPATLYIQRTSTPQKCPILTPNGIPVLRLPPGETLTQGKDGRICATRMAL